MSSLQTFFVIVSLFCCVGVKAQVGVTTQEDIWTTKKDEKTGKLAIYTIEGRVLLDNLDSIKRLKRNVFVVTKNNQKGIYDSKGKELIPIKYDKIEVFGDYWYSFWKVYLNGRQGLYTYEGKQVLPAEYENISSIDRGYRKSPSLIVKEKNKYGMFNGEGERLIKSEYDDVRFYNGHYVFLKGEQKDYLKRDRQMLLKGITIKAPITNWMNENGNSKQLSYFIFEDNEGKFGLLNEEDSVLIKSQYESMDSYYNFSSGKTDYLIVKQNSLYGVVNLSNEVVVPFKYKSFSKIYVRDHFVLEDEEGYMLCSMKDNSIFQSLHFDNIREAEGPYAVIEKRGKKAFLNKQTLALLFPFKYEDISIAIEDSLYCVKLNGKYGIVDKDDKIVIPYMYDSELYKVGGDKLVVNKDNKYGIINFNNQLVFGMISHPILAYDDYFQVMDISRNNPEYDWNFKEIKRE
nr:WG repeat-containing protein [uncultured Prevotella sp.]